MSKVNLDEYRKKHYVIDRKSAPNCWFIFSHLDCTCLLDIFHRIKWNHDIFADYSEVEKSKIKEIIIPALIRDGLIKETVDGFATTKESLMIGDENDKLLKVKNFPSFSQSIANKINEKNINNSNIFYFALKNVRKKEYDEINTELQDLKRRIADLTENKKLGKEKFTTCEFAFISFNESRKIL